MDDLRFDRFTRRFVLGGLARGVPSALLGVGGSGAKQRKKVKRNAFGCVDVGRFCRRGGQCCSGICAGKKGRKRCRAHNADVCRGGDANGFCKVGAPDVDCTTATGKTGLCQTTTGKAGFCNWAGECAECTKDEECVAVCGAGAACLVCAGCPEGTSCASPDECVAP